MKNYSTSLVKIFSKILNEYSSFLIQNKSKVRAMVDAVSCTLSICKHVFKKEKIQQSFCYVGEVTNIRCRDSLKYILCLDVDAIQKEYKIIWASNKREHFHSNLKSSVQEIIRNGYISEEWFDMQEFFKDTRIDSNKVEQNYSL